MLWEPPRRIEELQGPLVASLAAWTSGTAYTFTLEARDSADFIGRISIRQTETAGVWDIGFWTHPAHQGQGYMREAADRILEFAFEDLGAEAVGACDAVWNHCSRRVLGKIGMTFVRHLPQGFQKHGVWVAEDCLSVSRAAWLKRRNP